MYNCSKHGPYSVLCRMCDVETIAAYEEAERVILAKIAIAPTMACVEQLTKDLHALRGHR